MMNRTIFAAFVATLLLAASGCRGWDWDNPTDQNRTGTISGRITDAVTGQPIAGVSVSTDPATTNTTTDANGAYRIANISVGNYMVYAAKPMYSQGVFNVQVTAGSTSVANMELRREREPGGGSTGNALLFDGVNDYGLIEHRPGLNLGSGDITIEAWIKARAFGRWNWVLTKASSNAALEYLLGVDGRRVSFNVNNITENANSSQWHHLIGNTVLNEGEWYHIAGVYNSSTRKMQIYVNGRPDGATTIANGPVVTQSPVFIGARELHGTGRAVELFNGIITDVRLWCVGRTQSELNSNMNHRLNGTERGLVGYWPLSEGRGAGIGDRTGHGYNGSLYGMPEWIPADLPL